MKNIIFFFATILFASFSAQANNNIETFPTPATCSFAKKVTLSAGTMILLETNEAFSSDQATVGQILNFKVRTNVQAQGRTVITTGSMAIGRVKSVSEATFNSPAQITIELQYVQAVDGQMVALNPTEQTLKGLYPNEGTTGNIGFNITAQVMNDIRIKS